MKMIRFHINKFDCYFLIAFITRRVKRIFLVTYFFVSDSVSVSTNYTSKHDLWHIYIPTMS